MLEEVSDKPTLVRLLPQHYAQSKAMEAPPRERIDVQDDKSAFRRKTASKEHGCHVKRDDKIVEIRRPEEIPIPKQNQTLVEVKSVEIML